MKNSELCALTSFNQFLRVKKSLRTFYEFNFGELNLTLSRFYFDLRILNYYYHLFVSLLLVISLLLIIMCCVYFTPTSSRSILKC